MSVRRLLLAFNGRARRTGGASRVHNQLRLLTIPLIVMTIFGAVEFGEPLEDVLRGVRHLTRRHAAPSSIIVVGVDDRTGKELGGYNFSRTYDAGVVDRLITAGARRVVFDRTYAFPSDAKGDLAFRDMLIRHGDRVVIGAASPIDPKSLKPVDLLPIKLFREVATLASLNGMQTPFSLSAKLSFGNNFGGASRPSISTLLANRPTSLRGFYRPDWSIDIQTIPTMSFIDVVHGRFDERAVRGRDIIIGPTASSLGDVRQLVFQGFMPGVYLHVVGAHTLRLGIPVDLGWIPAFMVALIFCVYLLVGRHPRRFRSVIATGISLSVVVPIWLDAALVTVDVIPAILLLTIVGWRASAHNRQARAEYTNVQSGLPNHAALEALGTKRVEWLVAMKVRNFSKITASFDGNVEREFVSELCQRMQIDPQAGPIYQSEDGFLWLSKIQSEELLAEHLEGLHRIVTQSMRMRGRTVDVAIAFGVDTDAERHIASRIASALLCADEAGRANDIWKFHDPVRRHEEAWQLALMSRLEHAMTVGEIYVVFQPKLALSSMSLTGVEALVRWQHPTRGMVDPEEFIKAAEEHMRIAPVTMFVLDRALAFAAESRSDGTPTKVAVNISPQLLGDLQFAADVHETLRRHDLPGSMLCLEVTERGDLTAATNRQFLQHNYRDAGIQISLDDFGTKQATFERLHALHPDEVKIDRQFISQIDTDDEKREIVIAVIHMAHALGAKVVAEGVERQKELECLRLLGCDAIQGYLIARPMSAIEALAALSADSTPSKRVSNAC